LKPLLLVLLLIGTGAAQRLPLGGGVVAARTTTAPTTVTHQYSVTGAATALAAFPNLIACPAPGVTVCSTYADAAHGGSVQHTTVLNGVAVPADLTFSSDAAGSSLLSWEIESWNNATGAFVAWVRWDVTTGTDTIYAHIGNAALTTYQSGDGSGTWDANFEAVFHAATGPAPDSKLVTRSVFGTGSGPGDVVSSTSKIGPASLYFGGAALVQASPNATFTDYTASSWVMATSYPSFASIMANDDNYALQGFQITFVSGNLEVYSGAWLASGTTPTTGAWHYVEVTRSGSTTNIYIDNSLAASGNAGTQGTAGTRLTFAGVINHFVGFTDFFIGNQDEVRFSHVARSAAWRDREYMQQAQTSAWYTRTTL